MKTLITLVALFSLAGCIEEEDNCRVTDIVDHYKTTETEFYTVSEPVYKVVCGGSSTI